ncbi:hypothetical protein ACFFLM_07090 [Deinococcus oregonensis]|uniref:Uncharacterized protein n=1 Tax=Deinococcus oregonensis TaxID=1805970 RepID=A0ABV6AYE8_9DEIO
MSEAEIQLALKMERLNRFIDRLKATISDDIEVYLEASCVLVQDSSSYVQLPVLESESETHAASRILDQIQVIYADTKSEYWPQLG